MSKRTRLAGFLSLITAALWQLPAHGVPKAAEHKDAPVVIAPDVSKPKPAKKEVIRKKAAPTPTKKPHKPANATTKPKNRPNS